MNINEFRRWMVALIVLFLIEGSLLFFIINLLGGIQQFLIRTM